MNEDEATPIAWVRDNGNVVTRVHYSHPDPEIPTVFNGFMEHASSVHQPYLDQLPEDAVPLVPVNELNEARQVAEWLLAERHYHRSVAEERWVETFDERAEAWKLLDAIAEEIEHNGDHKGLLAAVRKDRTACNLSGQSLAARHGREALQRAKDVAVWLLAEAQWQWLQDYHYILASNQRQVRQLANERNAALESSTAALPARDTPEALRYAANVVEAFSETTNAHQMFGEPTDRLDWNASDLRNEADRRDSAARADTERDKRIESAARLLCKFDDLGTWADTARAMDDLGYRLDASQAKATS